MHVQNFETFVSVIGKALTGKRLEGKTLMNFWPLFCQIHQSFLHCDISYVGAENGIPCMFFHVDTYY